MDYLRLGNTGLKVSRLCLGAMTYGTSEWRPWVLDEAASRPFIARALDLDADETTFLEAPYHPLAILGHS